MSLRYRNNPSVLKDFLTFRRMLTPVLIQIFFWLAVLASFWVGVSELNSFEEGLRRRGPQVWDSKGKIAFAFFVAAPILLRILTESIILFFRMNETLTEVRTNTSRIK